MCENKGKDRVGGGMYSHRKEFRRMDYNNDVGSKDVNDFKDGCEYWAGDVDETNEWGRGGSGHVKDSNDNVGAFVDDQWDNNYGDNCLNTNINLNL